LRRYRGLLSKVMKDPDAAHYQDAALTVSVEEDEKFVDLCRRHSPHLRRANKEARAGVSSQLRAVLAP
jgi:hypothetical protein